LLIHRLKSTFVFCMAGLVCLSFSQASRAQQLEQRTTDQQSQQSDVQSQGQNRDTSAPKYDPESGGTNDRLFWTLPNFLTLENARGVPLLTTGQKFRLVARISFDPVEFPFYAFLAGISQADNSESGYGQGASDMRRDSARTFWTEHQRVFWCKRFFRRCCARIRVTSRMEKEHSGDGRVMQ
jgi:hypothetical protein